MNFQEIDKLKYQAKNVSHWAELSGYTRSHFSRMVKQWYGQSGMRILQMIKLRRIYDYIEKNPGIKGYTIAREFGFENEQNLYKFLQRHKKTNITNIRNGYN